MPTINFDNALGVHPRAMLLRTARAEVLANNIANQDTPNFKARDIDFQTILKNEQKRKQALKMERTSDTHMVGKGRVDEDLLYRTPYQPSVDGNTVDADIEKTNYTKNTMDFQSTFRFLNGKFTGLKSAIKGE